MYLPLPETLVVAAVELALVGFATLMALATCLLMPRG